MYAINTPTHKDGFYIFPHSTFTELDMADCNNTVDGLCHATDTIEQCIDLCKNDPNKRCEGGYFIQTPKENICVPLRSYTTGQVHPYYRLRKQEYYKELNNVNSTVFVSEKDVFPPNFSNAVFYYDNFSLRNVKSGLQLGLQSNTDKGKKTVTFTDSNPVSVQLIPIEITRNYVQSYVMVKQGDIVSINIPNTAFILKVDGQVVSWSMRATVINSPSNGFRIVSTTKDKKQGEPISFDEQFYFVYTGEQADSYLGMRSVPLNRSDSGIDTSSPLILVDNPDSTTLFSLEPRVEAYYCNNGKCDPVLLKNVEANGLKASYKGQTVSRSPGCWSQCGKTNTDRTTLVQVAIIILVALVVFIAITLNR